MLDVARVLTGWVKLVDLRLQLAAHVRVREQAVEYARQCAGGRIRPSNDSEHPVIDQP